MALEVGNALLGTGLAGAIHQETQNEFGEYISEEARRNAARFNEALARAIVNYIKANAEVSTTVATAVETEVEVTTNTPILPNGTGTGTGEGTGSGTGTGTIS